MNIDEALVPPAVYQMVGMTCSMGDAQGIEEQKRGEEKEEDVIRKTLVSVADCTS